jgi:hypothetical protein
MDLPTVVQQQARVASFVAQKFAVAASFTMLDDVNFRLKSEFQQRVTWDNFVQKYKDTALFRRHLRMSYESFSILVERIRGHVEVDDQMSSIRGGNNP